MLDNWPNTPPLQPNAIFLFLGLLLIFFVPQKAEHVNFQFLKKKSTTDAFPAKLQQFEDFFQKITKKQHFFAICPHFNQMPFFCFLRFELDFKKTCFLRSQLSLKKKLHQTDYY